MTEQPNSWVFAKKKWNLKFTERANGFDIFIYIWQKPIYNPDALQRTTTGRLYTRILLRNKGGTNDPQDEWIIDPFS